MLGFELIFGIALGFLPGTDNFAHIGGFLLGLLSSIALYPIISETQSHAKCFMVARAVAAMLGVVLIVVLLNNFYTQNPYSGEHSLSAWHLIVPSCTFHAEELFVFRCFA